MFLSVNGYVVKFDGEHYQASVLGTILQSDLLSELIVRLEIEFSSIHDDWWFKETTSQVWLDDLEYSQFPDFLDF